MQDRVSLYPGRVKLNPVSGQPNTFDLVRADQPTQEGTPLNKASLLKDTTAALLGLPDTAVPDDALAVLSRFQNGLGNEYLWAKTKQVYVPHWTEQTREAANIVQTGLSFPQYIYYSDEISVNADNKFVLENYQTLTVTDTNFSDLSIYNVLQGKYISDPTNGTKTAVTTFVLKWIDGTTVQTTPYAIQLANALWLLAPKRELQTTIYGYVNSPDPNAYPPAVDDGYTYMTLGQLGAKVQIEAGSYVGNGNSGAGNPNVVTLGFEAKLFMMTHMYYNDASQANLLNAKNYSSMVPFSLLPTSYTKNYGPCGVSDLANCYTKRDGNTLYWYVTSGDQFNNSGWTYNYLAIG